MPLFPWHFWLDGNVFWFMKMANILVIWFYWRLGPTKLNRFHWNLSGFSYIISINVFAECKRNTPTFKPELRHITKFQIIFWDSFLGIFIKIECKFIYINLLASNHLFKYLLWMVWLIHACWKQILLYSFSVITHSFLERKKMCSDEKKKRGRYMIHAYNELSVMYIDFYSQPRYTTCKAKTIKNTFESILHFGNIRGSNRPHRTINDINRINCANSDLPNQGNLCKTTSMFKWKQHQLTLPTGWRLVCLF